jgi:hypothetical protein
MAVMTDERLSTISSRADEVRFGRALAVAIGSVLFAVGWLVYKVFSIMWRAAVWAAIAVNEGWRSAKAAEARKRSGG